MAEMHRTRIEKETFEQSWVQKEVAQRQAPQPTISQVVPKPLAKTAADEFQANLDILKNPQSTQEQVANALNYITNNKLVYTRPLFPRQLSDTEVTGIADALVARIKLYEDPNLTSFPLDKLSQGNLASCIKGFDRLSTYTGLIKLINSEVSSEELINNIFSTLLPIPNYPNMEDGTKATVWQLVCRWCFHDPAYADKPEIGSLLGLDGATIQGIISQSPEPEFDGSSSYFQAIYNLTAKYRGEPVIKTLFEDTGITRFDEYPLEVLEHLYEDRTKATGKPIIFMVFTKRPHGVYFPGSAFEAADYKDFDVRVIEPGSDDKMVSLMKETSARLGTKFRYLMVNGHGNPGAIVLKRAVNTTISVSPNTLDVGDAELLKQIKPLLVPYADVILNACSTAGSNQGDANLANVVAEILEARCFGAKTPGGLREISFDDKLQITSVEFNGAETGVYDYRIMHPVIPRTPPVSKEPLVRHAGNIYTIPAAKDAKRADCTIVDLKGSVVTRLAPDASGNFVWNASAASAGLYFARIMEDGKTRAVKINKTG